MIKNNPNENIEIGFGMFAEGDGASGEMAMEWIPLGGRLSPQLKCFHDGWSALSLFPDLIEKLGELDEDDSDGRPLAGATRTNRVHELPLRVKVRRLRAVQPSLPSLFSRRPKNISI